MNRRLFLGQSALLVGGALLIPSTFAQIQTINDAINKSGRQRMLSQRLAKAYLQIGQGIDVDRSRKIFDYSMTQFEKQLDELSLFAPTKENKQVFDEMDKIWRSYKDVLTSGTPNAKSAKAVLADSEETLSLAQNATVQLEKISGTTSGKLVNISGRQRMLSQRMAKFYQALRWNVASTDAMDKLDAARKDFEKGLATLMANPSNTTNIKDGLSLAKQQWFFFDYALKEFGEGNNKQQFATNVATTSERILEVMDSVTGMYQQLS